MLNDIPFGGKSILTYEQISKNLIGVRGRAGSLRILSSSYHNGAAWVSDVGALYVVEVDEDCNVLLVERRFAKAVYVNDRPNLDLDELASEISGRYKMLADYTDKIPVLYDANGMEVDMKTGRLVIAPDLELTLRDSCVKPSNFIVLSEKFGDDTDRIIADLKGI